MAKLSVNIMPISPAEEIAELAAYAESKGFSRCWVYDEGLVTRDVYVVLAAIAARTEKILIGPGITNAYVRHPGVTASAIATIDEFSEGRAFLGLGSGGGLTLDPMKITRHKPLTLVREMVEVLRLLFSGETVNFSGEKLSLGPAQLNYGGREIDIFLAGRGPKMLELGAQKADGFYLSYIYKKHLPGVIAKLRSENRPDSKRFNIVYSTMLVTEDKELEEHIEEMAKDKAYAIGMAAAKKHTGDTEAPLEKSTIKKGHEIADKLLKKEKRIRPARLGESVPKGQKMYGEGAKKLVDRIIKEKMEKKQ